MELSDLLSSAALIVSFVSVVASFVVHVLGRRHAEKLFRESTYADVVFEVKIEQRDYARSMRDGSYVTPNTTITLHVSNAAMSATVRPQYAALYLQTKKRTSWRWSHRHPLPLTEQPKGTLLKPLESTTYSLEEPVPTLEDALLSLALLRQHVTSSESAGRSIYMMSDEFTVRITAEFVYNSGHVNAKWRRMKIATKVTPIARPIKEGLELWRWNVDYPVNTARWL